MLPFPDRLNLVGWYHLAFFGILLPGLAIYGRTRFTDINKPLPNRLRHFQSTALSLLLLPVLSLAVAQLQWIHLFRAPAAMLPAIAAGLLLYAAAVLWMWPRWRRAVERRARVVHLFMPANKTELSWWLVVSVLAGVGEEITWRGVQTALIGALVGDYWLAAFISALSFGLAHFVQGWKSAAVIVVFGIGFQFLVWLSSSLCVAMVFHVVYDITAGLAYGYLGRKLGYEINPTTTPGVSESHPGM